MGQGPLCIGEGCVGEGSFSTEDWLYRARSPLYRGRLYRAGSPLHGWGGRGCTGQVSLSIGVDYIGQGPPSMVWII